jgi:hypothetical protein
LTDGEEFRGLAQLTARGFSITLCAVQVRVALGYRCLPCVPFRNELEVDQLRVHRLQVLEPAVRADAVREVLALSAMLPESARRSGVLRAVAFATALCGEAALRDLSNVMVQLGGLGNGWRVERAAQYSATQVRCAASGPALVFNGGWFPCPREA